MQLTGSRLTTGANLANLEAVRFLRGLAQRENFPELEQADDTLETLEKLTQNVVRNRREAKVRRLENSDVMVVEKDLFESQEACEAAMEVIEQIIEVPQVQLEEKIVEEMPKTEIVRVPKIEYVEETIVPRGEHETRVAERIAEVPRVQVHTESEIQSLSQIAEEPFML